MRVCLVVAGDLDTTSGGFEYDRRLVAHLHEAGHSVSVVELPRHGFARGLLDALDPRIARRLRHLARHSDVLVQDELAAASLVGHNHRLDVPVVAVVHHLRASEPASGLRPGLQRAIETRYLRRVDAAVYASETTRRDVERLAGERPAVVAPPAGDRFDPGPSDAEIAARAHQDPFRVVFVGNLVPRKGLHDLLDGLARFDRRERAAASENAGGSTGEDSEASAGTDPDWRLSVVGAPPEGQTDYARSAREQARTLGIADRVTFEGRLSDDALADRLAESHLLAVPSSYEGYGIVYLEGMAFGLPALATTAGGASEIVTDGEDGVLVPPGDPDAIGLAVGELVADRERLAQMSLAAVQRADRHPGWDESMATVRRFLERIADEEESVSIPGEKEVEA